MNNTLSGIKNTDEAREANRKRCAELSSEQAAPAPQQPRYYGCETGFHEFNRASSICLRCGTPKDDAVGEQAQPSLHQPDRAKTIMELALDYGVESLRVGAYEARGDKWKASMLRDKRQAAYDRLRQEVFSAGVGVSQPVAPDLQAFRNCIETGTGVLMHTAEGLKAINPKDMFLSPADIELRKVAEAVREAAADTSAQPTEPDPPRLDPLRQALMTARMTISGVLHNPSASLAEREKALGIALNAIDEVDALNAQVTPIKSAKGN